jgi:hypothetical protein
MALSDLTDFEWSVIRPLLPARGEARRGPATARSERHSLALQTGARWGGRGQILEAISNI